MPLIKADVFVSTVLLTVFRLGWDWIYFMLLEKLDVSNILILTVLQQSEDTINKWSKKCVESYLTPK